LSNRIVFHIDFDYFYAQCEEVRLPSLKTKPVCVCVFSDRGGDSGAIATANYKAREFGVKSGIPIMLAKKKLADMKDAVFLPVDFAYYSEISEKAMMIIKDYGDVFEYVGKDEAYLEVTNRVEGDFQRASHLAQKLKNQIRDELALTCSVGISPNKLISKIASDFRKPDGLTVVKNEAVEEFLDELSVRAIPGIGKKNEDMLSKLNIKTIGELKKLDVFRLNEVFGKKLAGYIYNSARGIDDEPVKERADNTQFSKISTLKKDSKEMDFLLDALKEICNELHQVILQNNKAFKSVGIQFIQSDMSNKTKSRMLKNPTMSLEELLKTSEQLLRELLEDQSLTIRRLGVKVSDLSEVRGQNTITNYF